MSKIFNNFWVTALWSFIFYTALMNEFAMTSEARSIDNLSCSAYDLGPWRTKTVNVSSIAMVLVLQRSWECALLERWSIIIGCCQDYNTVMNAGTHVLCFAGQALGILYAYSVLYHIKMRPSKVLQVKKRCECWQASRNKKWVSE